MQFSEVVVAEAEGALLAHSLRTVRGRIGKGKTLSTDDLSALRDSGYASVYVARLEDGDIQEDLAAQALSRAIAGGHVQVGEAGTGRVYLYALCDGLLEVDVAATHAFNDLDEAITLATLQPLAPVRAGQVVATLKIIPFSVTGSLVGQGGRTLASGQRALLQVRPFTLRNLALIQTCQPDMQTKVLDKTAVTLEARLKRLSGNLALAGELRCGHRVDELAQVISTLRARGDCDMLVISTASATQDRDDVLPAAIRLAGGNVERVGMPVDPGNLLVLGELDRMPIIGMPGCARSPRANGFDWVLQRLSAALPVTRRDIAMMGVGGLLPPLAAGADAQGAAI